MYRVALVTGAARRIGNVIARRLHQQGLNVVLHYHHSKDDATSLCEELNRERSNSAITVQGDICLTKSCEKIILETVKAWGRLDILINNASSFYPTPIGDVNDTLWEDLIGSNLKGPFFLCQAGAPFLCENQGTIVNIVDIHAKRPLKNYAVYSIAKAGLEMLTKSLARELGPNIRVNGVSPGIILWPNEENSLLPEVKEKIIKNTSLKRKGSPEDIADTVWFLINQQYITGQIIAVDGGRSIRQN